MTFRYKDYQRGHRLRTLTLEAVEFLRRLMLHVPPHGFHRMRHFGFLANRVRQEKLAQCRTLLGHATQPRARESWPGPQGTQGLSRGARGRMSSLPARADATGHNGVSTASGVGPVCAHPWAGHLIEEETRQTQLVSLTAGLDRLEGRGAPTRVAKVSCPRLWGSQRGCRMPGTGTWDHPSAPAAEAAPPPRRIKKSLGSKQSP